MGDVSLVPEGDVLEGGLGVGADDAGEAGDLLAGDGIPFMRHRRRAFLLLAEELLCLADLGALEMANLGGDLVQRGAEDGERRDVGGVAIALDDLRGDGDGGEAEFGADGFLVLRLEMAECADGAGELADAEVFGGGVEAGEVALHLGVPEEELEAEGGGFGVDSVGAADDGGVFKFEGAFFKVSERARIPARMRAEASRSWRDCAVSTTSVEVRPKCSQREDFSAAKGGASICSATAVVKAMTSWRTSASISSMRATVKLPRAAMASAAACGTRPKRARACEATVSTVSHERNLFSSDQMRPMAGRV